MLLQIICLIILHIKQISLQDCRSPTGIFSFVIISCFLLSVRPEFVYDKIQRDVYADVQQGGNVHRQLVIVHANAEAA